MLLMPLLLLLLPQQALLLLLLLLALLLLLFLLLFGLQFQLLLHFNMVSNFSLVLLKLLLVFFWGQIDRLEGGGKASIVQVPPRNDSAPSASVKVAVSKLVKPMRMVRS
jgi:hypothetical protein